MTSDEVLNRTPAATRHVLAVTLAGLAGLAGCATYRGITSEDLVPRTELRVRFAEPRAVRFAGNADTLALDDVKELQGRMIRWDADSMRVGASRAIRSSGEQRQFGAGTTATFALKEVRLEEIQRHNGRTVALVAALIASAALLIAIATYEPPPPPPPPEPKPPKA